MNARRPELLIVAAAALACALALHWPLWSELGQAIPGEPGSDAYRAHWSVWLTGVEWPRPFASERINFPEGVDWIPFPAVSLWLFGPLSWLLGPDLGLPALIGLHTMGAVIGGWMLVRALGGGTGGGLLAGAVIATQPILGGALRDGTLEVLTVGWMPATLAAMILACRGSWRWGILTGILYLCCCLESVYHGSFMALAVILALLTIRGRAGLLGAAAAGLTVAAGAAAVYFAFQGVIDNIEVVMSSAGDELAALRRGNSATAAGLVAMAKKPGAYGWIVGSLYAPPMAWWGAFAAGALLSIRRGWWVALLGVAFTLLALGHDAVALWDHSPLGEPVRFPRRYMAAAGMAIGACAGLGLVHLRRWPQVELAVGAGLAVYLGMWGAHAGGFVNAYPLVALPEADFASAIASDPEDCAVLMVPLEIPGNPGGQRDEAPVFAELHRDIASSDHLYLQTRLGKAAWYAPSLLTLHKRDKASARMAKNLNDLAFGSAGNQIPASAQVVAAEYEAELSWLMGQGLKYVAVDLARYTEDALPWLEDFERTWAVETTRYEQDGTGVVVYRLYDERPEAVDVPETTTGGAHAGGQPFNGNVIIPPTLMGEAFVIAQVGTRNQKCPIRPGDKSFFCQGVFAVTAVWVEIAGVRYDVKRPPGSLAGVTLEVIPHTEPAP